MHIAMTRWQPRDLSPSPFVVECLNKVISGTLKRAIDAPCGYGRHAVLLENRGYDVACIDRDPYAIKNCKELLPNGLVTVADITRVMPFCAGSFGVAIAVHFVSVGFLRQMMRMLVPGGYLIYESFGGHGENWRSLLLEKQFMAELKDIGELLIFRKHKVGPDITPRISAKIFARRVS